jgi:cytochrome c biogenesis protein CcdA/thiol-disulfide isomerase/thioredoxin
MLLIVLAYLGGALTILSPCILPVLPFVFARADEPFAKSGLPLLVGMGLTFAAVASLAAIGGGWVTQANQYGRWAAVVLLAVFGITLLLPGFAERVMHPFVTIGNRLTAFAQRGDGKPGIGGSLVLGIATGLLWAPCAGPILGLVLTGAALNGASVGTTLLLLAYAAGAATSLAVALLIGGRVFAAMKRSLGAGEWVRRGIGAAMLLGVVAIGLGLDTGVLARVSTVATSGIEQQLVDKFSNRNGAMMMSAQNAMKPGSEAPQAMMRASAGARDSAAAADLPVEGALPPLDGAVQWLNTPPLTKDALRGKVVLVDVWTYSCINCLRTLPYLKTWAQKYRDQGLVVIGVHAPEFAFERNIDNVKKATHDLGIDYPVAIDNNYAIWRALNNQYWPAHYFVDVRGNIRYHHFGEGDYAHSEHVIQQLLAEAGHGAPPAPAIAMSAKNGNDATGQGAMMQADNADMRSPETYVGYERAEQFMSPGGQAPDRIRDYAAPKALDVNDWGLGGAWKVGAEHATLEGGSGRIVYRFHARDLHLVLGPSKDGKPIRFRVRLDGAAPGASHGSDIQADGSGTVKEQRLYQLVRQAGPVADRTFTIEFLDPGVEAYAFTFG